MCVSMNDGTCEGASYDDGSYSVQFHPEAGAGPHDTQFLFDGFADKVTSYHLSKQLVSETYPEYRHSDAEQAL